MYIFRTELFLSRHQESAKAQSKTWLFKLGVDYDVSPHLAVDIFCFPPALSLPLSSTVFCRRLISPFYLQVQSRECEQSQSEREKVLNFAKLDFTNISWQSEDLLISRDTTAGPSQCQTNTRQVYNILAELRTTFHIQQYSLLSDLELSETSFCSTVRRNKSCWTIQTTRHFRGSVSMSWLEERLWLFRPETLCQFCRLENWGQILQYIDQLGADIKT